MLDRRDFLMSSASFLLLPQLRSVSTEEDTVVELSKVLADIFNRRLDESPETATSLGLDKTIRSNDKSRLRSASRADMKLYGERNAKDLERLRRVNRSQLVGASAISYDTVLYDLETNDYFFKNFSYGEGDSPYVISQLTGAYQQVPEFLESQHTIESSSDCDAYIVRLREFARLLDQETVRSGQDSESGVIPPDFCVSEALEQMKRLQQPSDDSTLVSSISTRASAKGIAGNWKAQAANIYEREILPALERQIALMTDLLSRTSSEAGVWKLPYGDAYYLAALKAQTTTELNPVNVHRLGLEMTAQLSAQADSLFGKLGMTQGTVAQRYAALFQSRKYLYKDTEGGKDRAIESLNEHIRSVKRLLPRYFGRLPQTPLEIRRIPSATEQSSSTHYSQGSLDGKRPGIYWINLRNTAEMPSWLLPTITFHEGIPGHHLQLTLQKQTDLPLIRKITNYGAYTEGWATYSEQLVDEMGIYDHHPAWALGYIHEALLRSCRLVIDTGLHSLRWSKEKAVEVFVNTVGDPPAYAQQEVSRYCVEVGQACSYTIGKASILALREKMKSRTGASFDIRQFHDLILSTGSVPLTVLESVVDDFITQHAR